MKVDPLINAAKTLVYGDGVEDGKNKDGEPTSFIIETRDKDGKPVGAQGSGLPFEVDVRGPKGKVPHKIKDLGDGKYEVGLRLLGVCCFSHVLNNKGHLHACGPRQSRH